MFCAGSPKPDGSAADSNEVPDGFVCHALCLTEEFPRAAISELSDTVEKFLITMHELAFLPDNHITATLLDHNKSCVYGGGEDLLEFVPSTLP